MSGGTSDSYSEKFSVVNVDAGQTVIFDAGAEFILRKGSGVVIGTEKGGIADTTYGYDLPDGTELPSNHMLIVPVNDGRGFTASNDVIVMIKRRLLIQIIGIIFLIYFKMTLIAAKTAIASFFVINVII